MADFRPETFSKFIRCSRPNPILIVIWFGASVSLAVLFIFTFKNDLGTFFTYFIFILLASGIQSVFFYSMQFRIYNDGKKAFQNLGAAGKNEVLHDIPVYIRDFDSASRRVYYTLDTAKSMYNFEEADVILGTSSLVLLGKGTLFGSTSYASPVEIAIADRFTTASAATLVQWSKERGRIVIKIEDDFYSHPIKIEFKSCVGPLAGWLESACAEKLVSLVQ